MRFRWGLGQVVLFNDLQVLLSAFCFLLSNSTTDKSLHWVLVKLFYLTTYKSCFLTQLPTILSTGNSGLIYLWCNYFVTLLWLSNSFFCPWPLDEGNQSHYTHYFNNNNFIYIYIYIYIKSLLLQDPIARQWYWQDS